MYQLIPDDLISESEAASLLDFTSEAMGYRRRVSGDCPPFYDVGGVVRYSRREVLAWRRLRCDVESVQPKAENHVVQFLIGACCDYTEEGYVGPLDPAKADWVKASNLYRAYRCWSISRELCPVSGTKFGTLVSSILKKKRKSDGRYYQVSLESAYQRTEDQIDGVDGVSANKPSD